MVNYQIAHVTRVLNKSRETIRSWCKHFAPFLSPGASPPPGTHRSFTEADMEVLAYVAERRQTGTSFDDITAGLENGQRAAVPDEQAALANESSTARIARMESLIVHLRETVSQLEVRAAVAEGLRDDYARQIEALQDRVDRLNREIGRLEIKTGG